ncbi:hypothetical protein M8J76_011485 [Diaphorina citri]|nr:hypothetical protein M8J76_011485 [Diaphorina citri]
MTNSRSTNDQLLNNLGVNLIEIESSLANFNYCIIAQSSHATPVSNTNEIIGIQLSCRLHHIGANFFLRKVRTKSNTNRRLSPAEHERMQTVQETINKHVRKWAQERHSLELSNLIQSDCASSMSDVMIIVK